MDSGNITKIKVGPAFFDADQSYREPFARHLNTEVDESLLLGEMIIEMKDGHRLYVKQGFDDAGNPTTITRELVPGEKP